MSYKLTAFAVLEVPIPRSGSPDPRGSICWWIGTPRLTTCGSYRPRPATGMVRRRLTKDSQCVTDARICIPEKRLFFTLYVIGINIADVSFAIVFRGLHLFHSHLQLDSLASSLSQRRMYRNKVSSKIMGYISLAPCYPIRQ